MADFSHFSKVSPEWADFAKTWSPPVPPAGATPQQIRDGANKKMAEAFNTILGVPDAGLNITNHAIPLADGTTTPARLYRPANTAAALPVYLFFHGGGYLLGNFETEDANCRHTVLQTGVAVLHVNYRHTPEHTYPAPVEDAWAAYQWLQSMAAVAGDGNKDKDSLGSGSLGLDASRVVVGGVSAGATLAISVALHALQKEKQNKAASFFAVKGLLLSTPATVHPDHFPAGLIQAGRCSLDTEVDAPFLSAGRIRGMLAMYRPDGSSADVSPLLVPEAALAGLGHTVIHVAGMDPLRDEALLFEQKLQRAGVKTTLFVYTGVPHAFMSLPMLATTAVWRERMWQNLKQLAFS